MAAVFFVFWILLSGHVSWSVCLTGAVVSLALHLFCHRVLGYRTAAPGRLLRQAGRAALYELILIWEMLKAGFVVMKLIYTRGRNMEPVLVRFDAGVEGPVSRAVLADSITLTAGTITVEDRDGRLWVHALDRSLAEGIEDSGFARRLRRLEKA